MPVHGLNTRSSSVVVVEVSGRAVVVVVSDGFVVVVGVKVVVVVDGAHTETPLARQRLSTRR